MKNTEVTAMDRDPNDYNITNVYLFLYLFFNFKTAKIVPNSLKRQQEVSKPKWKIFTKLSYFSMKR